MKFSMSLILLILFASSVVTVKGSSSVKVDIVTTVGEVIDGDTFHTINDTKIRFADIDAPESYESGYQESKDFLASLVNSKSVYIDIDDISRTDQYGRYICLVLVKHNSSYFLNVNKAMVDNGYAVISDYTNNEFNPFTWSTYYSENDVSVVPEFSRTALLLLGLLTFSMIIIKRKRP